MSASDRPNVHADFRLLERSAPQAEQGAAGVSRLLRKAWSLPRDTFVTGEIPLLLTRLSVSERKALERERSRIEDKADKGD